MELNAYELALIAGGFAIAGTLIGVLSTYHLSKKLAERQFEHLRQISRLDAWHVAARKFIEAFAAQLSALEANSDAIGDVMDFLRSTFDNQSAAVAVFEEFLPGDRKQALHAAWLRHCYDGEDPNDTENPRWFGLDHDSLLFLHYSTELNLANSSSGRRNAIEGIRTLLAHAKDVKN